MRDGHRRRRRLAFRVEDSWWKVYYAKAFTMQDALPIASIRMALLQDKRLKQLFMDLMRECISASLEDAGAPAIVWGDPEQAPEHERSGRA